MAKYYLIWVATKPFSEPYFGKNRCFSQKYEPIRQKKRMTTKSNQ